MRFFDHNATTPLLPEAKAAWLEASEQHWLNPSSPYRAAAAVHARLEDARERLGALLDVDAKRIVFNSGATEGNNAVFSNWARSFAPEAKVAVGATEHPSVIEAAKHFFDDRVDWLAPQPSGVISPEALSENGVAAVSIMAANNETGVLNPWQDWAAICREQNIPMHCDASQWVGKMPLDGLGACDFVTACAHKFGGPKGVGFLIAPEVSGGGLVGGAQESGHRAGTEDLPGILAMVTALEASESKRSAYSSQSREAFLEGLLEMLPEVRPVGKDAPTLWNTASIIMPEFKSVRWIRALEKKGFLVSAGSACSAGKEGPSHVLAAMGFGSEEAGRALRISSGRETSQEDWADLLGALLETHKELKSEAEDANSQVISI